VTRIRPPLGSYAALHTLVSLGVALVWIALAAAASEAARGRHAAALEGELLRQAHAIEAELRDRGPEAAEEVLASALARGEGRLSGLALLAHDGGVEIAAGRVAGDGTLQVEVLLGRSWGPGAAGGPGGRGRGAHAPGEGDGEVTPARAVARRELRLVPSDAALTRPWSERALLPAAALVALALVAAGRQVGRALDRERAAQAADAERERLSVLGRAGAGLAHQLRTPLATAKGRIQLLAESGAQPGDRRLEQVLAQVERMERLLDRLLDFARPPEAQRERVELEAIGRELAAREGDVEARLAGAGAALVDPDHLQQILDNLIANARAAAGSGGRIELLARPAGPAAVELLVADRGPGPGPEPARWFAPYATGRADGTGLGLPIARALARANGGDLTLAARPGGGTEAVLRLERAEAAP